MDILIIIITILMLLTAILMALTANGFFNDKDQDGIPDQIEEKFNNLKEDIKEEINKLKK
jgi:sensor domain CHASE-containing protein